MSATVPNSLMRLRGLSVVWRWGIVYRFEMFHPCIKVLFLFFSKSKSFMIYRKNQWTAWCRESRNRSARTMIPSNVQHFALRTNHISGRVEHWLPRETCTRSYDIMRSLPKFLIPGLVESVFLSSMPARGQERIWSAGC